MRIRHALSSGIVAASLLCGCKGAVEGPGTASPQEEAPMRSGGFTAEDNSAAWPGVAHTRAGRQPAPVPPPDGGAPDLAVPDLGPVPPPQEDVFTPHGRAGGTLGAPKK